jgi:hypothetical protein
VAKFDSGASKHYFRQQDSHALSSLASIRNGPQVQLPNKQRIQAVSVGHLPLTSTKLTPHATRTHVFTDLTNQSLVSLGQLCDDACVAVLEDHQLNVYKKPNPTHRGPAYYAQTMKKDNLILSGPRNFSDGLWDYHVPLPATDGHAQPITSGKSLTPATETHLHASMNAIIKKSQTKTELAQYLYGCLGSPAVSTLTPAITNGNLLTFPGIRSTSFTKDLPPSLFSSKGHLDQERKNLQSTKAVVHTIEDPSQQHDFAPPMEPKTFASCATLLPFQATNKAYGDLTGRFPHTSSRGNQYLLVIYDHDSNAILVEPLKNKTGSEIKRGWFKLHERLATRGNDPTVYVMDNEASADLKTALQRNKITYQLVPPHVHRRNSAERAIRTFKNHFLAVLAGADPQFPVAEWDRLLPQTELTLNLLRNSRVNPKLSAYAYLFGNFDFNATPLAPPGTKVLLHLKSDKRASWAFHGEEGWYVGPSMEHYRCFKCFLPATSRTRDADTVTFFPKQFPFPKTTPADYLKQAATDMLAILTKPPTCTPFLKYGNGTQNALVQISHLLGRAAPQRQPKPLAVPLVAPPRVSTPLFAPPAPVTRVHASVPRVHVIPPQEQALHVQAIAMFQPTVNHIHGINGTKLTLDDLLRDNFTRWNRALSNEFGRLAQGNAAGVISTDTISFIPKDHVPPKALVTYGNFICDHRPLKSEPYRVRLTVGGDKLRYDDDAGSPAASLLETKLIVNSTISDASKGARFACADLKDFFLASPMEKPEFMKIKYKYLPADIRTKYQLDTLVSPDGYVYVKIKKGMYGLKQAAILAYQNLVKLLAPHGYSPCPNTPGLWRHSTRPTKFCLCVDDFGIKYFSRADATHLFQTLKKYYKVSVDMDGTNYCGLTLAWNYRQRYVDISMPGYVLAALARLQHIPPKHPQHAPHKWTQPAYGQRIQMAPVDDTPRLDAKGTRKVQSVVGSFLYYARAVDPTLLVGLNDIGTAQAKPTKDTDGRCTMLMDYAYTHPNAVIRYHASDMQLWIISDAAYLVKPNARSRYAGLFYLGDKPPPPPASLTTKLNGAILVECKTIKNVVASAAEAETGGVFGNAQTGLVIHLALQDLGHKQHAIPLQTDNSTAHSFVTKNIKQRRSKTWDMRWNWLRDKITQTLFRVYWAQGKTNEVDYFTKHHPPMHHINQRSKYILRGH